MTRLRPLIVGLALTALALGSGAAVAQQANPVLDFGTFELEIEPEKGPIQGRVSRTATIVDIDGTSVDLDLAMGFLTRDGWQGALVVWEDAPGKWADAKYNDEITIKIERETGDG